MLYGRERILGKSLCEIEILFDGDYCSVLIVRLKIYYRARENSRRSNLLRTGRRPIFDAAEKLLLEAFITKDSRTRHLSWEAVCLKIDYACSRDTVKRVMEGLGYHRRVPRRKFTISSKNKPLHMA